MVRTLLRSQEYTYVTKRPTYRFLRIAAFLLSGGALCQTITCSEESLTLASGVTSGWLISVVNQLLSMEIQEWLGTGAGNL